MNLYCKHANELYTIVVDSFPQTETTKSILEKKTNNLVYLSSLDTGWTAFSLNDPVSVVLTQTANGRPFSVMKFPLRIYQEETTLPPRYTQNHLSNPATTS